MTTGENAICVFKAAHLPLGDGIYATVSGKIGNRMIDLIVTTIALDSWKQNSDKGSVTYCTRHASEVHGEMAELLSPLRS